MALTDAEIQEVKYRLGYTAMDITARPYLDIVTIFEQLVQQNLNAYGENRVRTIILPRLTDLENERYAARSRFKVKQLVGEVILNTENETREYQKEFRRWQMELSMVTGVPIAPAPEFSGQAGGYSVLVS